MACEQQAGVSLSRRCLAPSRQLQLTDADWSVTTRIVQVYHLTIPKLFDDSRHTANAESMEPLEPLEGR